jgi:hypothetical protein
MKARRNAHTDLSPRSKPSLQILIIYEDYLTGNCALRTCDRLLQRFRRNTDCHTTSWKFELLRLPKLKKMAADEAVAADMIVVSAHAHSELPIEVKDWMDLWLPSKQTSGSALVALLHCSELQLQATCELPTETYLRKCASCAKLDYFCHYCETKNGEFDEVERSSFG